MTKKRRTSAAELLLDALSEYLDPTGEPRAPVAERAVEIHSITRGIIVAVPGTGHYITVTAKLPGRKQQRRQIKITIEDLGPAPLPRILGSLL